MRNPFTYRPDDPETDDWEDNPVSNTVAWASETFMPTWCKDVDHWTTRLVLFFWADCPCCLFFRGITLGLVFGVTIGILLSLTL